MDYARCAQMCKALSDETRLKIVDMLSCGELCACELLEHLEVSQSTLSYHMKTLTGCGLVQSTKSGSWAHYRLDETLFAELCSYIGQLSTYKEDCICKAGARGCSDVKIGNDGSEEKQMKKLEFYEPAMCCDTGLCSPGVDPELLRVATAIEDIAKEGGNASRHNLKSEPGAFVANETVAKILKEQGIGSLPITLVDGEVVAIGSYPSNERLSGLLGIELNPVSGSGVKKASPCCSSEPAQAQTSCCGSTEPASGKGSCCC